MESTSIRFAAAARDLGRTARLCGLQTPSFKSPPRIGGVTRSIRRTARGTTVAISLRERPWAAILADMIEGVLVANELSGLRADQVRSALWLAVEPPLASAA